MKRFLSCATPKAVFWIAESWTIDARLMTPSLTLKRPALTANFAGGFAAIYAPR